MRRHNVLSISMVVFLLGATAQAQQRSPNPRGGGADSPPALDLLNLLQALEQVSSTTAGQRSRGGRGGADTGVEDQLRELERFINRAGGPVIVTVASGAWWSNTALVARLGLSDDQKARIEKSFENHRLNLESSKTLLEKEEAQLARLLEAEPLDRNASLAQIYRVVNARGEMERTNAAMMLEMREHLTRAQWTQLQAQSNATMRITPPGARGPADAPATRGGANGTRGGRGQE